MIFKSEFTKRRFFNYNNRDFYDLGYRDCKENKQ